MNDWLQIDKVCFMQGLVVNNNNKVALKTMKCMGLWICSVWAIGYKGHADQWLKNFSRTFKILNLCARCFLKIFVFTPNLECYLFCPMANLAIGFQTISVTISTNFVHLGTYRANKGLIANNLVIAFCLKQSHFDNIDFVRTI